MSQPSRASEDSILACLARHFPATHPSLLLGRGDDCAVLKAGTPLCVSSDLFLEDVHFRRSYFTPEEIGHKALAVNVSDIAACGGRPLAFTLALGLPSLPHLGSHRCPILTESDHPLSLCCGAQLRWPLQRAGPPRE